jgi:hypothetical protein
MYLWEEAHLKLTRSNSRQGTTDDVRSGIINLISVSLLFSSTLFYFGPSNLFFYDIGEFLYRYQEVILSLVSVTLITTVVVSAVLSLFLRTRWFAKAVSVVLALSVLLWLQGNVLLWDYGPLYGQEIIWNEKSAQGLLECLIWASVLSGALLASERLYRSVRKIIMLLVVIQLVSLCAIAIQTKRPLHANYKVSNETEFHFSGDRNIVLLVLDAFNTDSFMEVIQSDRRYMDMLQGFTYFPDSVGGFAHTYPAIPLMLTGKYYDNSLPRDKFAKQVFSSGSLPQILINEGYHVYLPPVTNMYLFDAIASNIVRKKRMISLKLLEDPYLLRLTMFRFSPHYIKKVIYPRLQRQAAMVSIDNASDGHHDLSFIMRMQQHSKLVLTQPAFKYYHLGGLHEPYVLNEDLELARLPNNRSGQQIQARALMKIVGRFLASLKELGIYDETLILIVGDHGKGNPEMPHQVAGDNMAYLAPLVLAKPYSTTGKLRISKAPVALMDMPKTVLQQLKLDYDVPGISIFSLDETRKRTRRYLSYNWKKGRGWNIQHYPDMKEYHIANNSWLESSWSLSGKVYAPDGVKPLENSCQYGQTVRFGQDGNATPYLKHGWAHAAKNRYASFAIGRRASLFMSLEAPGSDLLFAMDLSPYPVKGMLRSQRVTVSVNGEEIGKWDVRESTEYTALIPRRLIGDGNTAHITFDLPDAVSPLDLKDGGITQRLSIVAGSFRIEAFPAESRGRAL